MQIEQLDGEEVRRTDSRTGGKWNRWRWKERMEHIDTKTGRIMNHKSLGKSEQIWRPNTASEETYYNERGNSADQTMFEETQNKNI